MYKLLIKIIVIPVAELCIIYYNTPRGVPRNFFRGGGSIFLLTRIYFKCISFYNIIYIV